MRTRLENTSSQGWRKGQRDHPGDHHGNSDSDGELLIEGSGHAAQESDRKKD